MGEKLTKLNKYLSGILFSIILFNFLAISNNSYLFIKPVLSSFFLLSIPGVLLLLIFRIKNLPSWEYVLYMIGLSISTIIFVGLIGSYILPIVRINKPLSLYPLLIALNIVFIILWIIAYFRNNQLKVYFKIPKLDNLNIIFICFPVIFLGTSISGAINLNNQGSGYLTTMMLAGIGLYVFFAAIYRNKLNENIYPFAILLFSASLLLMYSLRSWHISGWDILEEFKIFQVTKEKQFWSPLNFPGNPYNACLSITILPTMLSIFLDIKDEYIFKLIFPLIFSFTSLGIYLLVKKYVYNLGAFLAAFFFMSQARFITEMTVAMRQEISLLFFILSILILFNQSISEIPKNLFFIIFSFSMIITHYTTTYIALGLYVFTYLVNKFFINTKKKYQFQSSYTKLNLVKNIKDKTVIKNQSPNNVVVQTLSGFLEFKAVGRLISYPQR